MKVGKVRAGEKFVLDDRGGVWEKVGESEQGLIQARCFFGPRGVYGSTVEVDPRAYCYVIFEGRDAPIQDTVKEATSGVGNAASSGPAMSGIRMRIFDGDKDTLVKEIENPTLAQITAMSAAEVIRFVPPGKRRVRVYQISEYAYDMDENVLYVEVLNQRIGVKDEDEDREDRSQGVQPGRRDTPTPASGSECGGQATSDSPAS